MDAQSDDALLFDVLTPLGFKVHCTEEYWQRKVIVDHPVMADQIEGVKRALIEPDEVRLSRTDDGVYLFYLSAEKRLVCSVARKTDGDGFLITAYPTDKMKEGKTVWRK